MTTPESTSAEGFIQYLRGRPIAASSEWKNLHLVRTYADETIRECKGGLPGFRLRKVRDLMITHLEDEFSLIRLAREADMSEFHFSRAFKKTTGLTPSQYFIYLRMEKARRLLRETKRSVIEIGLDIGYTSPSHFAQIFRREIGVSPSEYRRLT